MTAGADAEEQVVRTALEAALDVAEAGLNEKPPRPPPRGLKSVLGFHKRPSAALSTVRRVLDRDDEFRALILERVDTNRLSVGAEAFLRRDEGWRDVVGHAVQTLEDAEADDRDRAAKRATVERVVELEARVDELEAAKTTALAELKRLEGVEARLETAGSRLVELETSNDELKGQRRRAVRELTEERRRLADRTVEVRELSATLTRLRSDVATLASGGEPSAAAVGERDSRLAEAQARAEAAEAAVAVTGREVELLAGELAELSTRLNQVGGSNTAASDPSPTFTGSSATAGSRLSDTAGSRPSTQREVRRSAGGAVRRRPVRVGRGLREGTSAATQALLETPGLVLWVDGYNVTMALWGDLDLTAQRSALIRALSGVATIRGTDIRVVFDGDTGGAPAVTAPLRVRVQFTQADVEADDDIIEAVATTDASTPVAVMSADRRVRDGVAALGANLLSPVDLRTLLAGSGADRSGGVL